ncbi:hypothetical protein FQN57_001760 [Myotisia sp. PD_48]|nr:hypothetical protein FQN57_001760 [Myotisia sp. PD_48]
MTFSVPSTNTFVELAKGRRSVYGITNTSPVPDSEIEQLVKEALLHVPSCFNTQSTRLVLLLHEQHEKYWDTVLAVMKALVDNGTVPEAQWTSFTKPKLEGFKAGYGTVLFYEDPAHLPGLIAQFPLYKDAFPGWTDHTNAMHQYFLWTGLESLGFGASLQHYNPIVDEKVAAAFDIPTEWRLVAQMPFGTPTGPAGEKTYKPIEDRMKVFGKKA